MHENNILDPKLLLPKWSALSVLGATPKPRMGGGGGGGPKVQVSHVYL